MLCNIRCVLNLWKNIFTNKLGIIMNKNIFAQFELKTNIASVKSYEYVEKTIRPFYVLNDLKIKKMLVLEDFYELNKKGKKDLTIVEGYFKNNFQLGCHCINDKKVFVIFRNKSVVGLIEIFEKDFLECINVFVKSMSENDLRLTLELALPSKLGANILAIRDEMIITISSNPSPSFHKKCFQIVEL